MSKDTLQTKYEELDAILSASYPMQTPEGMMHYVGLEKDIRTDSKHLKLGFRPVFAIIETGVDIEKAEETVNKRTFKGSFSPVRYLPISTSKYRPHQGKQECERRVRQINKIRRCIIKQLSESCLTMDFYREQEA